MTTYIRSLEDVSLIALALWRGTVKEGANDNENRAETRMRILYLKAANTVFEVLSFQCEPVSSIAAPTRPIQTEAGAIWGERHHVGT